MRRTTLAHAKGILTTLLQRYCEVACNCNPHNHRLRQSGRHAKNCPANPKAIARYEKALAVVERKIWE